MAAAEQGDDAVRFSQFVGAQDHDLVAIKAPVFSMSKLIGVDTFLGLQIAALEIVDDLARQGFCRRLTPWRSTAQWWRWMNNKGVD